MRTFYTDIANIVGEHTGSPDELITKLRAHWDEEAAARAQDLFREAYREPDQVATQPASRPHRCGHTELEAAMRWCPHVREVTPVGKGPKDAQIGNRYVDRGGQEYANPAGCCCIAGYCMQWRWLDDLRGYCGLSGKPTYQPIGEPRRLPNRTPLERPTASEQVDLFDE
jgi:hypothetical protein